MREGERPRSSVIGAVQVSVLAYFVAWQYLLSRWIEPLAEIAAVRGVQLDAGAVFGVRVASSSISLTSAGVALVGACSYGIYSRRWPLLPTALAQVLVVSVFGLVVGGAAAGLVFQFTQGKI